MVLYYVNHHNHKVLICFKNNMPTPGPIDIIILLCKLYLLINCDKHLLQLIDNLNDIGLASYNFSLLITCISAYKYYL